MPLDKRMKASSLVVFILLFAVFGCSTSSEIKLSVQSFYPLRVGNYQIYDVSQTSFNRLNCSETSQTVLNYQLKVAVTDSLPNAEGGYTYVLHRYGRLDPLDAWADSSTWTTRIANGRVISSENDIVFVKLIYPVSTSIKWNGNLYNTLGKDSMTVKSIGQPYTVASGTKFQNTFTVVQNDEQNLVYQDTRYEVYANTVGLVYKSKVQLNYFTDATCFGQKDIKTGVIYTQSLNSYGRQ